MAVEHYARPGWLAALVNRPSLVWLLYLVPALLLAGAVAVGGSFRPAAAPVRYAAMLPHLTLNLFFLGFTALAVAVIAAGVARAWRAWRGPMRSRIGPARLARGVSRALAAVVLHRDFGACEENRWRRWAHLAMVVGFVVLAALAGVVALIDLLGGTYPFPPLHPLKLVGNGAGLLLLFGIVLAFARRIGQVRRGEPVSAFDWLLLVHLAVVVLTGFAAEILRYTDLPAAAYPTWFVHLVAVFVLLVLLPWSKLAHVAYRTAALALRESLRAGREPRTAASCPAPSPAPVRGG
jgi:quinone-modifying oxidoreductase subunit QmoC